VGLCRKFRLKFGLNFDKFRVWVRSFWWAFLVGSGSLAGSLVQVLRIAGALHYRCGIAAGAGVCIRGAAA